MTNLLYLFNPDQDLALASGEVNYMPPASARRMAEELALLPVWFADGPCSVLAPSAYNPVSYTHLTLPTKLEV